MRKPTFCLYKCENEVADQMRGKCNCAADQRLCLRYRDNTSVCRTPKTGFFATRLIFNYNYKQPLQEGLFFVFVCFDSCLTSWYKFFSHVETEPPIPGYYQYFLGVNVSCSRKQHTDPAENRTRVSRSGVRRSNH